MSMYVINKVLAICYVYLMNCRIYNHRLVNMYRYPNLTLKNAKKLKIYEYAMLRRLLVQCSVPVSY